MTAPARGPTIRSVAMPAEHGGWGLTLEPGLLGVLLAPSPAGVLLAVAAVLAFLLRTPLRLLLVRRLRPGERSTTEVMRVRQRLATRVTIIELFALGGVLAGAVVLAQDPSWLWPLVIALPLFAVAFYFDVRSRSRHIIPQVVGSVAVAAVAAMGTLAGGGPADVALGAWLILAGRVFSSIPHVRVQIGRIHRRDTSPTPGIVGDVAAIWAAAVAVLLEPSLSLGAAAIVGLVVVQRMTLAQPPPPAKTLGIRQMALGFAVVGLTTMGVWLA